MSGVVSGQGGAATVVSHLSVAESCEGVFSAPRNEERVIDGPGFYGMLISTPDEGPFRRCVGVVLTDSLGQRLDSASADLHLVRGRGMIPDVKLDLAFPTGPGGG